MNFSHDAAWGFVAGLIASPILRLVGNFVGDVIVKAILGPRWPRHRRPWTEDEVLGDGLRRRKGVRTG